MRPPFTALNVVKDVEPFKLFFLEDALAPEDIKWFERIRQPCSTPLAMGELFNLGPEILAIRRTNLSSH